MGRRYAEFLADDDSLIERECPNLIAITNVPEHSLLSDIDCYAAAACRKP